MAYAPLKCVYCGSPDISAGDFEEVDSYEASRKVSCKACDQWWWEIYVFSLVENEAGDEIVTYNTPEDGYVKPVISSSGSLAQNPYRRHRESFDAQTEDENE